MLLVKDSQEYKAQESHLRGWPGKGQGPGGEAGRPCPRAEGETGLLSRKGQLTSTDAIEKPGRTRAEKRPWDLIMKNVQ